jgi:hypothetical protein
MRSLWLLVVPVAMAGAASVSAATPGERTAKASEPRGSVRLRSRRALAFPRYGERSTAFRLVFSNKSHQGVVPATLDVVVIDRGAADTALFFANP